MSTFRQHGYYQEQPQVLVTTNTFGYLNAHVGYDAQRSKTPTSLINHTGHSPVPSGPLSTPPHSRYPSQPPEQVPEHMVFDDAGGSLSNSPASVHTPDDGNFDFEMLDASESMASLYQPRNGGMLTTEASQAPISAMDVNAYFTEQELQAAFNATLASFPQQQQQHQPQHTQFNTHSQSAQNMVPSQSFNQFYSQDYITQPSQQDPWNGQGPPRDPTIPRTADIAVFDPESDPVNYQSYLHLDVPSEWPMNDPAYNYLISPHSPTGSAFNNGYQFSNPNHSPVDTRPNQSPVDMMVAPSPTSQFVNYNQQSSFFSEHYITDNQFSTSSMASSQISNSPYPSTVSPQPSAQSPGSDGVFSSYQHSESGMVIDSYLNDHFDTKPVPSSSPVLFEPTPRKTVPSVALETSPSPEPPRRQPPTKGSGSRSGGRALGTHLEPKVAKAAHDMRKIVACWHCVLQRDKCGPGNPCQRCEKRSQRPNADCGLGCSRIKLVELVPYFLPTVVTQMHEDQHLTHFVSQYIHQWGNQEITIYMTCGQAGMPRIPVKVYEFVPKGEELLVQIQYNTDPTTHKRVQVRKKSPALGMVHINHNEEKKYDKYINDIVDGHLDAFGELCWMDDDNDFQQKLFRLMTRVKPKSEDEAKLLREVFRLIVCTFIMAHTISIAEETKHSSLSKMHSYTDPNAYISNYTSPRMTNRQLKYFFCRIHRTIMSAVLNKLQQIFKSSKGCDKWLAAFIAVVGMCMAHEDQQKTIHLVMETKAATEGCDRRDAQARADIACREIDVRMSFINQIFRWKYNRKCNPLRDADHDWEKEAGFGDASSVSFVRQVAQLVKENIDFLQVRQSVSISSSNQTKYTSRLVGQFLLSFWLPT